MQYEGSGDELSPESMREKTMRKCRESKKTAAGSSMSRIILPSFSIHRIQECHVALLHILWDLIHVAMGEEGII